jgi:hypothetical protein
MSLAENKYSLGLEIDKALEDFEHGVRDQVLGGFLLKALGCPHLIRIRGAGPRGQMRLVKPALNPNKEEAASYLYRLLTEPEIQAYRADEIASMLSGVSQYDCTKMFLQTEDSTYRLAYAVIYWFESRSGSALDGTIMSGIDKILSGWLTPDEPDKIWSPGDVCRHLFGDAWCEFALPNVEPGHVGEHIYTVRPTFVPGVCRHQADTSMPAPLPDME